MTLDFSLHCFRKSEHKQVVISIRFPADYPSSILLIELKSKTLPDQLLAKVTGICEVEAKRHLNKPQVNVPLLQIVG